MSRKDFEFLSKVDIDNVLLDISNPRIRTGSSQQDCINRVLRKEDQMHNLMKSIAKEGLTTMPILVCPHDTEVNKWIVKDGNRRITALKLLNNPSLCLDIGFKKKIEAIIKENSENISNYVDCLTSNNKQAIMNEILARHSGAMGGAGHYDWTAYLRTVFLLNNNEIAEYKRAGQYIFWAEKHAIFVDDDFPISSIARFFNVDNLKLLGFKIENDNLLLELSEEKAQKMAMRVINDFSSGTKKVNDVFTAEQAKEYLNEVRNGLGIKDEPDTEEKSTEITFINKSNDSNTAIYEANADEDSNENLNQSNKAADSEPMPIRLRSNNKPAWDRKKLFHRGSPAPAIKVSESKARTVVFEMKQLNIQETPLAAIMLLRGLLELSIGNYLKEKNINKKESLAKDLMASADSMLQLNLLSKSQFELIRSYAATDKNQVGIFNVDTLQKYLHRDTHQPSFQTLNTFWDEIAHFVAVCWMV